MPSIPALYLPARIWNFPGAYVVLFATGVSCSAAIYTTYHYLKESPDVELSAQMRQDELKTNPFTAQRAHAHVSNSFFRKIASLRNSTIPGEKDTRIFRV